MWERFSYYGMRALLVLYMVKYLLLPAQAGDVVGLAALQERAGSRVRAARAAAFRLADLRLLHRRSSISRRSSAGCSPTALLGQRRTVIIGAALMAVGHFLMAFEPLFLFALLVLILGNGCFKPNISTQVGSLYAPGDRRRDRAFSIFYVGINLGAFLAPLVCGTLGEELGWHYGFAAAGVGMTHRPRRSISLAAADAAAATPSSGATTSHKPRPRRMARDRRADGAVPAGQPVLGHL